MSCIKRMRRRMKNEGTIRTFFYLIYVCFYCSREYLFDLLIDLRYSRKCLKGNLKTLYKHLGANDVYHTKYSAMPLIFRYVPISKGDVLVDIGCGKGRVINYWLCRKLKNKIIGLELDKDVAKMTKKNFARWKNVTIIQGDAIENLPKDGTIFYFYNPFSEEIVQKFEEALAQNYKNKPITIVYYNPKSVHVFRNSRWRIKHINFEKDLGKKRWGRINKYHELAIIKNNLMVPDPIKKV